MATTNDIYLWMDDAEIINLVLNRIEPHGYEWDVINSKMWKRPYRTGDYSAYLTPKIARDVLSASDSSSEDETNKLLEFFWGCPVLPKPPQIDTKTCKHEWIDVILFNLVTKRCKFCDIKKPSDSSEKPSK